MWSTPHFPSRTRWFARSKGRLAWRLPVRGTAAALWWWTGGTTTLCWSEQPASVSTEHSSSPLLFPICGSSLELIACEGVSTCEGPYPSMFSRVTAHLDFVHARSLHVLIRFPPTLTLFCQHGACGSGEPTRLQHPSPGAEPSVTSKLNNLKADTIAFAFSSPIYLNKYCVFFWACMNYCFFRLSSTYLVHFNECEMKELKKKNCGSIEKTS